MTLGYHGRGESKGLEKVRDVLFRAIGGMLCVLALTPPAYAARAVDSAFLSYATQNNLTSVRAPPNAVIPATVTVRHSGPGANGRWRSTSWRIGAGALTCVNHANYDGNGTDSETFDILAPAVAGAYDVQFTAYQNDACTQNASATFTLSAGVVVDSTAPSVTSINRADPNPTGAASLTWTITFDESVTGVDATDFALVQGGGVVGAAIVSVTGGPNVFSVTASSGSGDGSLGLNLVDNDSIADLAGNPLGGGGAGNGSLTGQVYTIVRAGSFNAVEPGANAASGAIFTKIAGQNFALDIVALNSSGGLSTGFTGTVAVEVVNNAGGGACNSLPVIAAFTNQTFVAGDAGRHPLTSPNTVTNVYRNAKVRIRFPAGSPTVISCSSDSFAIRPATLTFAVSDANRTTAGTTNALNNAAIAGATVHNAGRPFRVAASAYNAAATPAITTNYDGSPTAVLAPCAGTACTATTGTLSFGAWSASAGTVTTTTATYDDVGAFALQLVDSVYAAIDAAAGTSAAQRTISSAPVDTGRFVPDRFVLSAASITPRASLPACAASTFTYMGERMDAAFTLIAVRFPAGTTARYSGALARLALSAPASFGFGALDGAAPTPLSARLDTSGGSAGAWANGVANVVASLALQRAAAPDGPYSAVRVGIAPADPDGVTLDAAALNLDADNNGSSERAQIGAASVLRFGRLRLQNAHGSQLVQMPLALQAQYWNGTAFVTNTDDNCTAIAPANVALGNYRRNLGAGETTVSTSGTLSAGTGTVRLSAPGATNEGSVDVSINLTGVPAGASCTAGMSASTPTTLSHLQGAWCGGTYTNDPTARATFGVYGSSERVIFQRENY